MTSWYGRRRSRYCGKVWRPPERTTTRCCSATSATLWPSTPRAPAASLGGADADEAVELLHLATRDANPDDPNRAAYQFNLGAVHRARFRRQGDSVAARDAASAFLAAAAVRSAPTFVRATAAFNAGRIAADAALVPLAADGFAEAVALLDRLAWPGLPRDDQEELLRRFSGVATDAAAWALECGEPERAVELIERGRGVLLAQAIDARSPYVQLRAPRRNGA